MNDQLPNDLFLTIPYGELEERNSAARDKRDTVSLEDQESEYRSYLEGEERIRTVTLCFSDRRLDPHFEAQRKRQPMKTIPSKMRAPVPVRALLCPLTSDL